MRRFPAYVKTKFEKAAVKTNFEICALVYDNQIHFVDNIHANPRFFFSVKSQDILKAYRSTTGLQCLMHSHTTSDETPSVLDQKMFLSVGCGVILIYYIV